MANGALGHPDSDDEILANLASRRRPDGADAAAVESDDDDDYVLTELRPLAALPEIRPGAMPARNWNWSPGDLRHGTMPFSDVQGLALGIVLPDEPTALDFVELFVKEEDFVEMTEQTNKYARDYLAAIGELPPCSRFRQWHANGITVGEMKCFIAVTIVMGLVRKDAIEDYWSTDAAISTPFFQNVMPRDKFGIIMSFFHLADNALYVPHGQPGYDLEKKLGSVYANMLQRFTSTYKPSQQISIDEGVVGFRGNVKFKQFNPNKPEKYGIKAYKLCDAKNGYCSRFELYTAVPRGVPSGHGSTYDLVFRLAQPYLYSGRVLYTDNYYSSPQLFLDLYACGMGATGTARNRRGVPENVKKAILKNRGDHIIMNMDPLVCAKLCDRKVVMFLSTVHSFGAIPINRTDWDGNPISRSELIHAYYTNMGAVDTNDQMITYSTFARRTVKWWKKVFLNVLSLAILNSYILYKEWCPTVQETPKRQKVFRRVVAMERLTSVGVVPSTQTRPGRPAPESVANSLRLTQRHFIQKLIPKDGAKKRRVSKRCVVCNPAEKEILASQGVAAGTRPGRETSYECKQCLKALCVEPCFELYHSYANYILAYKRNKARGEEAAAGVDV